MTVLAAVTRDDVAGYVQALIQVYTLLIFAYIVSSLVFSMGARIPYNRGVNAVLGFLRDVCEPYLRIFRRFIPMVGPLDLSPIVGIFVLQIVGQLVVNLIRG
jgi:uncharacterized protein YggT (Ycf19 family)